MTTTGWVCTTQEAPDRTSKESARAVFNCPCRHKDHSKAVVTSVYELRSTTELLRPPKLLSPSPALVNR
jgi:hypothetical protein